VLTVGRAGYLPTWLQHTNQHGVQTHILIVQGLIVTALAVMFVVLPSVQAAYQILSQLTVTLYLIMYLLMFAAAIWLRHAEPATPRTYRVPGGTVGMWIVGGAGFIGSLLAFGTSFIPPGQIAVGSPTVYVLLLIGGNALFIALPLVIYALRRPDWKTAEGSADFEPFNWEKSGR
jgi:amino acid transporter